MGKTLLSKTWFLCVALITVLLIGLSIRAVVNPKPPLPLGHQDGSVNPGTKISLKNRPGDVWYDPVPLNDPQLGFLEFNRDFNGYHLAVDLNCSRGEPVHALAGGRVLVSRSDLSGYGGLNKPGGAVLVLHQTSGGNFFKALYGHLEGIKVRAGSRVEPGQVLGAVNEVNHLHFGIHLGGSLPSPPCLGYTRSIENTHGWVDPMVFLDSHSPWAPNE